MSISNTLLVSGRSKSRTPKNEQGAVLLIGLVMLLMVTLIGVTSMQSVTLDEKVASNMQSATLAYHGAEVGLTTCESSLLANGLPAVYNLGSMPAGWQDDLAVWANVGFEVPYQAMAPLQGGVAAQPVCVAEYVGDGGSDVDVKKFYLQDNPASRPVFRVSSWSRGGELEVEAKLESMFICPGGCAGMTVTDYDPGS